MPLSARIKNVLRFAAPVVMILFWLGLSSLHIVARKNPEALLRTAFARYSREDAFEGVNDALNFFWWVHSSLVLLAIAAARSRRSDIVTVFIIGPIIAMAINLASQEWTDPSWCLFVSLCTIGWLVSAVVGSVYWGLYPIRNSASLGRSNP